MSFEFLAVFFFFLLCTCVCLYSVCPSVSSLFTLYMDRVVWNKRFHLIWFDTVKVKLPSSSKSDRAASCIVSGTAKLNLRFLVAGDTTTSVTSFRTSTTGLWPTFSAIESAVWPSCTTSPEQISHDIPLLDIPWTIFHVIITHSVWNVTHSSHTFIRTQYLHNKVKYNVVCRLS